jgi:hypothetical protein
MKLIFLDFDGVLNSRRFLRSDYFKKSIEGLTDAQLYILKYEYMLDPEAIKLVNGLVSKSGAEVVASTSHRNRYTIDEMNAMLKGRGATFEIIAKTPRGMPKKFSQMVDRGDEIQEYLDLVKEAGETVESFVILDDNNNMVHLTKFLVLTRDMIGITQQDTEDALKILNGEHK